MRGAPELSEVNNSLLLTIATLLIFHASSLPFLLLHTQVMWIKIIFLSFLRVLGQVDQAFTRRLMEDDSMDSEELAKFGDACEAVTKSAVERLVSMSSHTDEALAKMMKSGGGEEGPLEGLGLNARASAATAAIAALSGGRLGQVAPTSMLGAFGGSLERHQGPAESGFISSPGPTEARTVLLELLSAVSAQALTLDRNAGRTHVALPPEAVAGARDALRRAWAGLGLGTQPLEAPPSMSGRAGGGQPLERDAILTFIQRGATEETLGPLGPRARK